MELTKGMLVLLGSGGAFVLITAFLLIYLALTGKKMKKILSENEFPEE